MQLVCVGDDFDDVLHISLLSRRNRQLRLACETALVILDETRIAD